MSQMSRRTRARLLSLLLLLGVLAGIFAAPAGRTADASGCCEFCYPDYQYCMQSTGGSPTCDWRYEQCLGTCSYC